MDMREHDVPYHIRFCIDEGVRCGHWFNVSAKVNGIGKWYISHHTANRHLMQVLQLGSSWPAFAVELNCLHSQGLVNEALY